MTRRGVTRGMGYCGPYGGVSAKHKTVALRSDALYWRCGYPELPDLLDDPEDLVDAGAIDTGPIEDQMELADEAGFTHFVYVMHGSPRSANSNAGSADHANYDGDGQWHHIPNTSGGCTIVADYAAEIATACKAKATSLGITFILQYWNEVNIPSHNHRTDGDTNNTPSNAADYGEALAEVVLAVRAAEPSVQVWSGSFASRGDLYNGAHSTQYPGYWAGAAIAGDARLRNVGADARPNRWVSHPYTGSKPPLSGWTVDAGIAELTSGFGSGGIVQMIHLYNSLAFSGATDPSGGGVPKVVIGEYGAKRRGFEGPEEDPTFIYTDAIQQNYVQQYLYGFDILTNDAVMGDVWLAPGEMYYQEFGDEKSLYQSAVPNTPFAAGGYWDFLSLYDPPVPPDPDPEVPSSEGLDVVVELGIPPTVTINTGNFMIGDDPRGELGGDYGLASFYQYVEITGDVQEIQVDRGNSRALDRSEAGTCTVTVRNDRTDNDTAGDYDPFNWASPFFPFLGPRARIRVKVDGTIIFSGDLTDIPVVDVQDNVVVTTFEAADILGALNQQIEYKPEAIHTAGERIHRILERAGAFARGDGEYVFPGVYTYQRGIVQTGTALDMCNDVAFSEGGKFYASNQGNAYIFIDHNHMHGTVSEPTPPLFTATDDPSTELGIRYSDISSSSGLDLLYNTVTIRGLNPNSKPQSVHSDESASIYGERPLEFTSPMGGTSKSATALMRYVRAQQLLNECRNPQVRFASVTFPTARYGVSTRRPFLINQEVGHVIAVERTRPGDVFPATYTQNVVICGVSHTVRPRWMQTTFQLTPQFPV